MLEHLSQLQYEVVNAMVAATRLNMERDGGLVPFAVLVAPDGTATVYGMSFKTPGEREGSFAMLAGMAETLGSELALVIGEAWVGDGGRGLRPREDPLAADVASFSLLLRDDGGYFGSAPIRRAPGGKATFGEVEWQEVEVVDGDLARVMPTRRKGGEHEQ